jgi:DsbC/DsbD-like thiol-disulfide interchange protein
LALSLDYAICERLCVPAKGEARLDLAPGLGGTPHSARIAAFSAKTPVPAPIGAGSAPGFVQIAASPDGKAVTVDALVPANGVVDLFVEGPEGWVFGSPVPLESREAADARAARYRVPVEAKPEQGRLGDLDLILTLAAGAQAIETRGRLDAGDAKR